ncbi:MAG: hypothetical protein NWQ48_12360, partial [Alishewanella sp.]|nr:hypothetical protein [Alishewanella sp.]
VCGCAVSGYKTYMEGKAKHNNEDVSALQNEIAKLKNRVATLESIVTEPSYQLKEKINKL